MSLIIADVTDTAVELSLTANDASGGVTGLTIVASVYDPAAVTNKWLNMSTGAWQPSQDTQALNEVGASGHYVTNANTSNAANRHLRAYYEITVGAVGIAEDGIVLVGTLDAANEADQSTILADVGTIETATTSYLDAAVSTRAVTGAAMTLTSAADESIADAVWDEDGADHLTAGTAGYLQDQAATGGAGVTPLQIQQAVWDAEQSVYNALGSMGRAVSDSQNVPEELEASIDRYFQIVRQYGPIAAQQPIATRDEIHIDDVGIILTVPVILDGAYSDLGDATSIDFDFISPSGVESQKAGAGVTTPTGSYTTWTTDDTVFDAVGRWRVQVTVTWPDVSTKASLIYAIDIQPPMPAL